MRRWRGCARTARTSLSRTSRSLSFEGTGGWEPGPNGGFIGYFHDLFDAFEAALADRTEDGHLISESQPRLGSDDDRSERSRRADQMRTLLERAYCEGVLVIGSRWKRNHDVAGPRASRCARNSYEGLPERKRCKDGIRHRGSEAAQGRLRSRSSTSVGAVDLYDERLPTVRAWAHPRIAAYGTGVTIPEPKAGEYSPIPPAARRWPQRRSAASQPTSGVPIPASTPRR